VKHDIDLIIIMRRPNLPEREEICRRGNMSERERERERERESAGEGHQMTEMADRRERSRRRH